DAIRITVPHEPVLAADERQLRKIGLANHHRKDALVPRHLEGKRRVDLQDRPLFSNRVARDDRHDRTGCPERRIDLFREAFAPADVLLVEKRLETVSPARLVNRPSDESLVLARVADEDLEIVGAEDHLADEFRGVGVEVQHLAAKFEEYW